MPKHHDADSALTPALRTAATEAAKQFRRRLPRSGMTTAEFEGVVMAFLMAMGRTFMQEHLERLGGTRGFVEAGKKWWVAVRAPKKFMTQFGWVEVNRPLYRGERNGPTRCLVSERADLVGDEWTPCAARIAARVTADASFGGAEELLREFGAMAPSASTLQRLDGFLSARWEEDREANEQAVRESSEIPPEAVAVAVSLDGVMVNMIGSDRAKKVAKAKARGRPAKGPSGYKEAAVGVVSFYDSTGERLATWRTGRMPEADKSSVKAWLKAELACVRALRPDLVVVAAADGSPNNWSFLEGLRPDFQVVDYYHVKEHVHRALNKRKGASSLEAQAALKEAERLLLEDAKGAEKVAALMPKRRKKTGKGTQPTLFERHVDRMNYRELRSKNLPIGTGVTEGTCRHLVVDRLRRSGMSWSARGGQAVMTLRAHVISGGSRFEAAWSCLLAACRRYRLAA